MKKALLFMAALGSFSIVCPAQAMSVLSWELMDYNNDGLQSDFTFSYQPPPSGQGFAKFGGTGETGCKNAPDGDTCVPIITDGRSYPLIDTFTKGFVFTGDENGTGWFKPTLEIPGGIVADITNNTLTFSALQFSGRFPEPTDFGVLFYIPPNNKVLEGTDPVTGEQIISGEVNPAFVTVETLEDLGNGQYGVVVRWTGRVLNSTGGITDAYAGFQGQWRVEGVMSTVPVPAAVWLFGSGLLGLIGVARRRCGKIQQ